MVNTDVGVDPIDFHRSLYFFYETRFFYILFLGADLSFDIELDDIDLDQLDKETVSEFILQ